MKATSTLTATALPAAALPAADAPSATPHAAPAVDSVVEAIGKDARQEPLKYVLRSNTSHDGE